MQTGVGVGHARDLLRAFRQDASKRRYADWNELRDYCRLSASPVGRFLLDLHGEEAALYRYSDPLCDALQVLNHLQDIAEDCRRLDRIYLPADWMDEEGVSPGDLVAPHATPGLRRVIDRCLDACDGLIRDAENLPGALKSRRLAMEAGAIVWLARRLSARLRKGDPLAARVAPGRCDFAVAAVRGVLSGFFRRRG